MPTPPLPDSLLIEALNIYEEYGGYKTACIAGATKLPAQTFRDRVRQGQLRGLKPTFKKDAPRIYTRQRLGRMHLVIPDCQVRPDVDTEHLRWIGNYIVEKKPDVIVQIGDFADLPSLSSYTRGKKESEGKRLRKDIDSVAKAMEKLVTPIHDYNRTATEKYMPEMHLTYGNHEYRMEREVEENARLEGMFCMDDLGYRDFGFVTHPFLKVIEIDGIEYAHYFVSGNVGRPVTSAAALLRERQKSCTMGHVQHTDMAIHKKTQNIALFCGICYMHDEPYLTPQGNATRRQIIVKHEVENGRYDPMLVSLRFLEKAYG